VANEVRDNAARRRYELDVEGGQAFIDYRRNGNVVTMLHAEVPAALEGHGIGSALVRGALELVRTQGERIVPACPFVAAFVARHREFEDLVAR
jgi:uncharacterized protein